MDSDAIGIWQGFYVLSTMKYRPSCCVEERLARYTPRAVVLRQLPDLTELVGNILTNSFLARLPTFFYRRPTLLKITTQTCHSDDLSVEALPRSLCLRIQSLRNAKCVTPEHPMRHGSLSKRPRSAAYLGQKPDQPQLS